MMIYKKYLKVLWITLTMKSLIYLMTFMGC
jgi:hypothetical protein